MPVSLTSPPAWLLLMLSSLFWAGNALAGRFAVGEISPQLLVSLRWTLVALLMVCVYGRAIRRERAQIRPHLGFILTGSFLGLTSFNSLLYIGLHTTTALNAGIIQGSIPVFVILGAALVYRSSLRLAQWAGVALTTGGVIYIGTAGDMERLLGLAFNPGDAMALAGCACFALYTLMLRHKPPLPPMVFFTLITCGAALSSLPLALAEFASAQMQWPTARGGLLIAYTAIFASLLAQMFFIWGVSQIGPARAGVFINLVPVFTVFLAWPVLGETPELYNILGLAIVLTGIALSERIWRQWGRKT